MSLIEIAIRAACKEMGANPDAWRAFESIGVAAVTAILEAVPDDVRDALESLLE